MKENVGSINVSALVTTIGDEIQSVQEIACGSTSNVWKLSGCKANYVLKSLSGRPARVSPDMDAAIREAVSRRGGRVARSIATSAGTTTDIGCATPWAIEEHVNGTHFTRGDLPVSVCHDLGQTLAALHDIDVMGSGTPSTILDDQFVGTCSGKWSGLELRFEISLPTIDKDCESHPLFHAAPSLIQHVRDAIEQIKSETDYAICALCHTDLHERQIICTDSQMAALVDFGEATIADARWDFASLFYFHGEVALRSVIDGYTNDADMQDQLWQGARLYSIGIALHHASRSRLPGKGHRLPVAIAHLSRVLSDHH